MKVGKFLKSTAICASAVIMLTLTAAMGPGGGGPPPGGGMGGGPRGGAGAESEAAVQRTIVEAANPAVGGVTVAGSFVGTVEPGRQLSVYPKASGEVIEANFAVGDTIEAGEVLFRLDSADLELSIAQTRASLATRQASAAHNLEIAQENLRNYTGNVEDGLNAQLLAAENGVKTADLALTRANMSYRDARDSYHDYMDNMWTGDYGDTTADALRSAVSTAEIGVETAQLTLENAKASLQAVKKQIEEAAVTAENSVKSAEINSNFTADNLSLQIQMNNLENFTVATPISGIIEQKNIDVFDTVSPQIAAYVISDKDTVTVSFSVAESALTYLRGGDSVVIQKNGDTCIGIITEISTMVNPQSGLFTVKATVQSPGFELRSGSTVKLTAETQKVENAVLIPIDAVYHDNGQSYVYLFENNSARRVDVELGISDEENVQVLSGVTLTDMVITTYSSNLIDGAEVYLPGTEPEEAAPEAADGEAAE